MVSNYCEIYVSVAVKLDMRSCAELAGGFTIGTSDCYSIVISKCKSQVSIRAGF